MTDPSIDYIPQQFLFDKGTIEMEISGKNRYIKCLSSEKIAYATGKI